MGLPLVLPGPEIAPSVCRTGSSIRYEMKILHPNIHRIPRSWIELFFFSHHQRRKQHKTARMALRDSRHPLNLTSFSRSVTWELHEKSKFLPRGSAREESGIHDRPISLSLPIPPASCVLFPYPLLLTSEKISEQHAILPVNAARSSRCSYIRLWGSISERKF